MDASDYADRAYAEMVESERRIGTSDSVSIGDWTLVCCEIDLHQIATQEEVDDIRAEWADAEDGELVPRVWATREAALEWIERGG